MPCDDSTKQKWLIDRRGKIESIDDDGECLAQMDLFAGNDVAHGMETETDTSWSMWEHLGENAVDGIDLNYWLSAPGKKTSFIKVTFDQPRSFKKIEVNWKYPPLNYTISLLIGSTWTPIKDGEMPDFNYELDIPMTTANGIQISMSGLDENRGKLSNG